ncbi:MAG: tRNA (adenosine(37)-N6)-threonylcarbamoyltransferase complex dimerization subunit type 1 TsaB [Patescibacteria group bacterium]|nr:tRNA (adenosine(37)-N6)-threonylcarbamoyltransferase complex dimerization subunit type 1 TsaB [Patescibacteria group bacterium]
MFLAIDAADAVKTRLYLLDNNFVLNKKVENERRHNLSEKLLDDVDKLLKSGGANKKSILGIFVHRGPGSYTGLRIGLSTANFIAYSLNVPIVGYEGDIENDNIINKLRAALERQGYGFKASVVPFYKMPPHITKNKSCLT